MRSVAEHFADFYGVSFYYEDFRIGWQDGIDLSKELGLYRPVLTVVVYSAKRSGTVVLFGNFSARKIKRESVCASWHSQ